MGVRFPFPLALRHFRRARRSVAVQWASGGAACGGNAAALRRDYQCSGGGVFYGVIGRLRRSHPLLEGGGPKGRGILIAEGGSFGASSPKELARRERTTLLAGSTPYDIWELPFQGLPSAARPDLRKSPLRVIGRLRSEADAMKAPVGLSSPRFRPKGGMGCTTPNPYFKAGISKGRPAP